MHYLRSKQATKEIHHVFVNSFPDRLENDTIYISIKYKSAAHNCMCGCGEEIHTKISPAQWKLTFDGDSISLYPSIGNWKISCKSHYWIFENKVYMARQWSDEEIEQGQVEDFLALQDYYGESE